MGPSRSPRRMDVFGRYFSAARNHLILVFAVTAMITPGTTSAGSTSTQLQVTLVVLPSCNVASFNDYGRDDTNRVLLEPRVSCKTDIPPLITYSRERPSVGVDALQSEEKKNMKTEIDTRNDMTIMTLCFF
jgi:hypothetical protein